MIRRNVFVKFKYLYIKSYEMKMEQLINLVYFVFFCKLFEVCLFCCFYVKGNIGVCYIVVFIFNVYEDVVSIFFGWSGKLNGSLIGIFIKKICYGFWF